MRRRSKKIIAGCLAGALLIAGVGAIGGASKGFKDWDTKNWKQNLEDVFKKEEVEDGTTKKVQTIDVDQTSEEKVYMMPSGSVNFGESGLNSNTQVVQTELLVKKTDGMGLSTMGKKGHIETFANSTSSTQFIQLVATVTPNNADLTAVTWEIIGIDNLDQYLEIQYPNGQAKASDKLTIKLVVKQAFSQVGLLKVTATNGTISVSDTCSINYYKQYQGFNFALAGDVADKVLSAGEKISYTLVDKYGTGTIDQLNLADYVVSYQSNITAYTINYDFKKNDETKGDNQSFDYDVFYGATGNFTGVNVLTGAGRNSMNARLGADNGDFIIKVTKGGYTQQEILNIAPEEVTYPESVQIGDGTDVEIGKN